MGGRDAALAELERARAERRDGEDKSDGLVAVLDADWDRLEGSLARHSDVVWTDFHDLDMILIASPALDKLLAEVASRPKLAKAPGARETAIEHAVVVGKLRWASKREGLRLAFRKKNPKDESFSYLRYASFCDAKTWTLDKKKLVREARNFSQRHDLDERALLDRMARLPPADPMQLCVGHDVVGLLSIGLKSKLGNRSLSIDELEERLRLAFEREHLHGTIMYRDLKAWEERTGYPIFPQPRP